MAKKGNGWEVSNLSLCTSISTLNSAFPGFSPWCCRRLKIKDLCFSFCLVPLESVLWGRLRDIKILLELGIRSVIQTLAETTTWEQCGWAIRYTITAGVFAPFSTGKTFADSFPYRFFMWIRIRFWPPFWIISSGSYTQQQQRIRLHNLFLVIL